MKFDEAQNGSDVTKDVTKVEWSMPARPKHWFLTPSLQDRRYVCGGWQIFNRAYDLVSQVGTAEIVTYRHRESETRYLDDIPREELRSGIVWITWQSHVLELSERLSDIERVVLYAQNTDFGLEYGQRQPDTWPIVCLSRFIAADYSVFEPWRLLLYLGPALHPSAKNLGLVRDIDVLVHKRKSVPYVFDSLVPALQSRCNVHVLDGFVAQDEFLKLLNRSKTYLYWFHKQTWGIYEGFGMQPLEAIACGATPVSNFYGGLSDYLEAPHNCRKIGVYSLDYDVAQILDAANIHPGHNPHEERIRECFGERAFHDRFARIERELLFYFEHLPSTRPDRFAVEPPPLPRHVALHHWAHRTVRRTYKRIRKIRPV